MPRLGRLLPEDIPDGSTVKQFDWYDSVRPAAILSVPKVQKGETQRRNLKMRRRSSRVQGRGFEVGGRQKGLKQGYMSRKSNLSVKHISRFLLLLAVLLGSHASPRSKMASNQFLSMGPSEMTFATSSWDMQNIMVVAVDDFLREVTWSSSEFAAFASAYGDMDKFVISGAIKNAGKRSKELTLGAEFTMTGVCKDDGKTPIPSLAFYSAVVMTSLILYVSARVPPTPDAADSLRSTPGRWLLCFLVVCHCLRIIMNPSVECFYALPMPFVFCALCSRWAKGNSPVVRWSGTALWLVVMVMMFIGSADGVDCPVGSYSWDGVTCAYNMSLFNPESLSTLVDLGHPGESCTQVCAATGRGCKNLNLDSVQSQDDLNQMFTALGVSLASAFDKKNSDSLFTATHAHYKASSWNGETGVWHDVSGSSRHGEALGFSMQQWGVCAKSASFWDGFWDGPGKYGMGNCGWRWWSARRIPLRVRLTEVHLSEWSRNRDRLKIFECSTPDCSSKTIVDELTERADPFCVWPPCWGGGTGRKNYWYTINSGILQVEFQKNTGKTDREGFVGEVQLLPGGFEYNSSLFGFGRSPGHGAAAQIPSVAGAAGASIHFPIGTIPSVYSMCSVTRYCVYSLICIASPDCTLYANI